MKTYTQRSSRKLWDVIATRAITVPVKAVPTEAVPYSSKEYVTPAERQISKIKEGVPIIGLDPPAQRIRAKLLRYNRQTLGVGNA